MRCFLNMKIIIFLAAFAAVVTVGSCEDSKEKAFEEIMKTCQEIYNVDEEVFASMNETGKLPDDADNSTKCFVYCLLEKTALIDENSDFNIDVLREVLEFKDKEKSKDEVEEVVKECVDRVKDEKCKCEKSYKFAQCIKEKGLD